MSLREVAMHDTVDAHRSQKGIDKKKNTLSPNLGLNTDQKVGQPKKGMGNPSKWVFGRILSF